MSQTALRADEQEEAAGRGEPLLIKLGRIEPYKNQPRRYFDEASIRELADDIYEKGQKTPVKVFKHPRKSGVFILIGGERRYRAFHLIQERTGKEPVVKAWIEQVSDERHLFEEALYDNLQREDLVALDEAAAYKRLYDESNAESHRAKIAEIAHKVRKTEWRVENYMLIDSLPFKVKKLLDPSLPKDRQLQITAAIDIARSTKDPELQFAIAKEAIERDLGLPEIQMLIVRKVGNGGFGAGGSSRRPSDDYRTVRTFYLNTLSRMTRIRSRFVLDDLYASREDETEDRKADAKTLRSIIKGLEEMLKEVESPDV